MKLKIFSKSRVRKPALRKPDRPSDRPQLERLEDRWLMSAGDLDLSFDTDGKLTTPIGAGNDDARAVAIQADGRIVVAGRSFNGSNYDFGLARYNTDGSLDTSLDADGKVTTPIGTGTDDAYAVAIQSDGKIVVAGRASISGQYDFALVRYNIDGSLDTTFSGDGKQTSDFVGDHDEVYAIAIQADGKIVVAGRSRNGNYDFALARYNSDGTLDTSFDGDGKVTTAFGTRTDRIYAMAFQSDGKIVAAGYYDNGSNFDFALARYNTDGSLDTSFDTDGKLTTSIGSRDDEVRGIGIQSDGKVVAGGFYDLGGGNWDFALARYNTNGSLDTSFDTDGKVTTSFSTGIDEAHALAIQYNGKIVLAGFAANSTNDFAVARYNTNGSLDTTFDSDGKLTTAVGTSTDEAYAMALQSNRKIVVVGRATVGAAYDFAVSRYEANNNPTATGNSYSLNEDTTLTVSAPGVVGNDSDVDGDSLTAVLVTGPSNGSLSLNADGSFSYTPNTNFNGSDSFTYQANDGSADSNVATVTITVSPLNDPPTITVPGDQSVTEGQPIAFTVSGSDIDGDALTFSATDLPSGATFDAGTHTFLWTPGFNSCERDQTARKSDSTCRAVQWQMLN